MTNAALGQLSTTFAYVAGAFVFWLEVRRKNMATEGIGWIALAGLCGGVLGAKLSEWVLLHSQILLTQPQLFLDPRMGGRTVVGGVLAGWLCVEIAKKQLGIRRSTGDSFALALPLGETIGRIGCWFNGCCYGVGCERNSFAVWQHGTWRVPTQFVLGAAALLIFCVVLTMRNKLRDGEAWLLYLSLFGASRFVIEFWRERSVVFGALSFAQIVCLVIAISSTRILWKRCHKMENEAREVAWKTV